MSRQGSNKRVYILGIGNLGKLFANALATVPYPPPITLLLHRPSLQGAWAKSDKTIKIIYAKYKMSRVASGFDVESVDEGEGSINHLIVATKAHNTASAIEKIKHRISPLSELLFLQNGMGTIDEVNEKVFPEPLKRPNYLIGITSHGVYRHGTFSSALPGRGTVSVGLEKSFKRPLPELAAGHPYLLHLLKQDEVLNVNVVSEDEILMLQLEKLVMNAMINPLTVIYHCENGVLIHNPAYMYYMRKLLREASKVIRSLKDLQGHSEVDDRFSVKRLEQKVVELAKLTSKNTSSMLADFKSGKKNEIDYINGYIVKKGKDMGIDCSWNEELIKKVKKMEKEFQEAMSHPDSKKSSYFRT